MITQPFRVRRCGHIASLIVARVRPRTSKGITDLLLLYFVWLNATCPSKKFATEVTPRDNELSAN